MIDVPPQAAGRGDSSNHLADTDGPGQALTASAGMVIFAAAAHAGLPLFLLAGGGLLLTSWAIAVSFRGASSRLRLFGFTRPPQRTVAWVAGGLLLGIGLAFILRSTSHRPILPTGLEPFVLTAIAIGAAEELLFRGFIQGRFAAFGWGAAVALAAFAHTTYKVALFAFPPEGVDIRLGILGLFTFLVGLLLGFMRHRSGSVFPPLCSHVAFDILVYGDWEAVPWWIWG